MCYSEMHSSHSFSLLTLAKKKIKMHQKILLLTLIISLSLTAEAYAKSCKKYRSCAEVIADFPNGNFGRKDRDGDGIPCENVCKSRKQVEDLLKKIGKAKKKSQSIDR